MFLCLCGCVLPAHCLPLMPQVFDRATVTNLLDTIDQPRHAMFLKAGYFTQRTAHPLPLEEGYKLLQAAAAQATPDTNKWFRLQALLGYAAFTVPKASYDDGFAAYNILFEHADEAAKVKAFYPLQEAVYDFVFSVPTRLNKLGLQLDERVGSTLAKAWKAYVLRLSNEQKVAISLPSPPWAEAISSTYNHEIFMPLLEKTLADKNIPHSYELLKIAAVANEIAQRDRAIEILQEAKPLLPPDDPRETVWLYDTWQKMLFKQGKTQEIIPVLEERVQRMNRGHAELLEAYLRSGNEEGFQKVLALLSKPNAPEREIKEAAMGMSQLYTEDKEKYKDVFGKPVSLLEQYLRVDRKRSVEMELWARLALYNVYLSDKEPDKAKDILKVEHIKTPLSSKVAEQMYKKIQKIKGE